MVQSAHLHSARSDDRYCLNNRRLQSRIPLTGRVFHMHFCRVGNLIMMSLQQRLQEGWLSPTERASVSAISLIRHILAFPAYAPGTIAVNVTWMKRGFNACQTHCSMYPSIFNRFPVIQPVSSKVRHFSTFFAHFGLPWVRSWENHGKFTCLAASTR